MCGSSVGGLTQSSLIDLGCWWLLLSLGLVEIGGLAGPALIGESSELFDLRLPDKILLLLLDARGMLSDMSQPLVPLRYVEITC